MTVGVSNVDSLELFFAHLALSARVFLAGRLCGTSSDHATGRGGHLHVVRNGTVTVLHSDGHEDVISEPTVLLYPRPELHTFQSNGADIVCAFVEFGAGLPNPVVLALPKLLRFPICTLPELQPTIDLLFSEGFAHRPGRQIAVDRLAEYLFVVLLRAGIDARLVQERLLPAFSDSRLSRAAEAIQLHPEKPWRLHDLAEIAGMSRARFASHFRESTGHTPFEYLTQWRVGVAQSLLRKGEPLKLVAPYVGYTSISALNRAFSQYVGMSPMAWLKTQR